MHLYHVMQFTIAQGTSQHNKLTLSSRTLNYPQRHERQRPNVGASNESG